jgi:hypothetical protein
VLAQLTPYDLGAGSLRRQGEHVQQITVTDVEFVSLAFNGEVEVPLVGIQHGDEIRCPALLAADEQWDLA